MGRLDTGCIQTTNPSCKLVMSQIQLSPNNASKIGMFHMKTPIPSSL